MSPVEQYLDVLCEQFSFDVGVFSNPWILYTVIPAVLYFVFFLLKWMVLTVPVWMPFSIVVGSFKIKSK
jgi:hypothetical protein